jgi:GNAT superfamily N-acetyltransferase
VTAPVIREATDDDLEAVVGLHAADAVGHGDAWNETTEPAYRTAFAVIAASADSRLYVAVEDGRLVGSFLLTFMPGLTGRGMRHAVLRSVQVAADCRSRGIGAAMVAEAERLAAARGAGVVELTSNLQRDAAHRFYRRLGYVQSHAGFKKLL